MLRALAERWRQRQQDRALQRSAIPDALWQLTLAAYPFLGTLAEDDLQALRRMSSLFLDDKRFHGVDGFEVSDEIAVAVAAQACLPVLKLGLQSYAALRSIVLHADEVVARRQVVDEDGVVHEYDEPLVGEASVDTGQMMLAWTAVQDAGAHPEGVYNVVIHEFAHLLDALNGDYDGIPALPTANAREHWLEVIEPAYDRFCRRVDAGRDSVMDPYGTAGLEEFFAVAAEAFFVAPGAFKQEQPSLYRLLRDYFRQDPAAAEHQAVPLGGTGRQARGPSTS